MHNNGQSIGFIKPSECRMGGEFIQLLRIYRLKDVLCECITSKVFLEMKEFHFLVPIIKSEAYWDYHFSVIQALYPLYCLLRLADIKEPGIDKLKYYVMQFDHLLDDGISNICSKIEGGEGAVVVQKVCNVICDNLPETDSVEVTVKREGNLKKAEEEEEEESK